jgi:hypothetical protein
MFMLAQGLWRYEDHGILAKNHIRFFTLYEIQKLLQKTAFTPPRIAALVKDDDQCLPLSESGHIQSDNVTIGPLNDEEYRACLVQQYLVLTTKSVVSP